jgi:hypothetical protein
LENWLRVDLVWDAFGMSESSEAWVHDLLKADLDRLAPEFTLSVYVTFAIRVEPVESLAGPRALAMHFCRREYQHTGRNALSRVLRSRSPHERCGPYWGK